jgi:hypothetical protein
MAPRFTCRMLRKAQRQAFHLLREMLRGLLMI